jgi:hypothetical protein
MENYVVKLSPIAKLLDKAIIKLDTIFEEELYGDESITISNYDQEKVKFLIEGNFMMLHDFSSLKDLSIEIRWDTERETTFLCKKIYQNYLWDEEDTDELYRRFRPTNDPNDPKVERCDEFIQDIKLREI